MINQSKQKPERFSPYTQPFGCGLINYMVEEVEMDGEKMFQYESTEYASTQRDHLIEVIIRDRYSPSKVEAITQNYLINEDTGEFAEFQRWRKIAKIVADGGFLKSEIEGKL
jgi:hypothetical protein